MADLVKHILARPIQLADQVIKFADEACNNKQDCAELKSKTEKLAGLLRQAARASNDLYERPTKRIIDDTEQVLDKALTLTLKCRNNGFVKRVFTLIPAAAFRKMSSQLENSIGDVSWLLRVSAPNNNNDEYLGLPPIAANEPILCLIWEQIAILYTGTLDDRSDAAASLVSLARDNDRYGKLIIEEGGVVPLLKLVKEGSRKGRRMRRMRSGCLDGMMRVLKEGPMKVQAVVAWAVSELVKHYPKCQDMFAQHSIVRLLVGHLAFETVEEHSKYAITSVKPTSIHAVVLASNNPNAVHESSNNKLTNDDEFKSRVSHPSGLKNQQPFKMHNIVASTMTMKDGVKPSNGLLPDSHQKLNVHHSSSLSMSANGLHKGRELEDPETKARMKSMAARALWYLAKDNSTICRSITESRALLCFAVLLEKGPEEVKFNSAMAVMEITSVAEQDPDLRRSAFKPNSPACKALVEQLLQIIEKADSRLLLPCVRAIGNLARTFRATESRMIQPLVQLLEEREAEITKEAVVALTKFACTENYLHLDHSKAIIGAGGAKHLIQLVYFGEHMVQTPSLTLLCYIALHVADSEDLAQAEVLTFLEWASNSPI
ncbi:putative adaptor protein Cbl domain superfamily [Helianthus annuus]|nr:putative adaptor protein Cbl domain superfamily [Helianthus annuus]